MNSRLLKDVVCFSGCGKTDRKLIEADILGDVANAYFLMETYIDVKLMVISVNCRITSRPINE